MSVVYSFSKGGSALTPDARYGLGSAPRNASEAIFDAGLDWEVLKEPQASGDGYTLIKAHPPRATNRVPLACGVSADYTPLQNRQAFALLDPLVQAGAAVFDSAGTLGLGRTVWVLAKMLRPIRLKNVDVVERYLLLVNNHSGFFPQIQVRLTPVRVSCRNMLATVLRMGRDVLPQPAGDVHAQLRQAQERLLVIDADYSNVESEFRRMADTPMTSRRVTQYVEQVLPEPVRRPSEKGRQLLLRIREEARRLFESGKGNDQPGIRGTLWAAYNGVTELVDHHIPDKSTEGRLQRILFGDGYEVKVRAWEVAWRWRRVATRADAWRFAENRNELLQDRPRTRFTAEATSAGKTDPSVKLVICSGPVAPQSRAAVTATV
jgi:phage/plasmid-like protein (TIGR03299 family)